MNGEVVAAFVDGILVGAAIVLLIELPKIWRNRRLLESPLNVCGDFVLPTPDDPRWSGPLGRRRLGFIAVLEGHSLYVDGRQLPADVQSSRYCVAVVEAALREAHDQLVRKVDASVQGQLSAGGEKIGSSS